MVKTLVVATALAWPAAAAARPAVTVGEAVPFSAGQLADAIELRGDSDATVHVTRRGDELVVEAGASSQTVAVAPSTSEEAARVVAMVVVALVTVVDEPRTAPPGAGGGVVDHPGPIATPAGVAAGVPSRWSARATVGVGRDDGGTWAVPVTAALSYRVAPSARIVASAGLTQATAPYRETWTVPLKLGIEGRSTAVGLELGVLGLYERVCDSTDLEFGGYASGRIYMALDDRKRLVLEGSVYYMRDSDHGCYGEAYGGYLGGGVEWDL